MLASSKIMLGVFPPSSRVVLLIPHFLKIPIPTAVDPVKDILSIPLCLTRASPATEPYPGKIFTTPSGSPHYKRSSPNLREVRGVFSAGFSTTVQPVARAGAILKTAIRRGKFHGVICPHTPTGSSRV